MEGVCTSNEEFVPISVDKVSEVQSKLSNNPLVPKATGFVKKSGYAVNKGISLPFWILIKYPFTHPLKTLLTPEYR